MDRKIILLALCVMLILVGCAKDINDVKTQENIGKKVTVSGTVEQTVKLGKLSGYIIKDETGSIGVSSQSLPAEGSKITVKGVLMKDTLLGYYIISD
ncbi:MAG: hypothetical protein KKE20_00280 [Nanoarchaeota archaeon]|nr:hypothetical protein [Nanoarchaeota archaeon]